MATISITTTADQDAAVQYSAAQFNATSGQPAVTALQYAKTRIDQFLNGLVERWRTETRTTKVEAYAKASAADQAAVDSILAKYQ